MLNKNGRRSVVNASSVMAGDELIMAGEKNVFVSNVQHFSTRYRNPSHVVITFRHSTGRPEARTYEANDRISVIETPTTYKARRRNSWRATEVALNGKAPSCYIKREKNKYPVQVTRTVSNKSRTLVVNG